MARIGKIDRTEMLRATNMGIGMVVVVRPSNVDDSLHTRNTALQDRPNHSRRTESQLSRMRIRPPNRRIGILLSGRGSNFEAIAESVATKALQAEIAIVISNIEDAPGLARARERGLNTAFIPSKVCHAKRSTGISHPR
jgi:hypothetical protein